VAKEREKEGRSKMEEELSRKHVGEYVTLMVNGITYDGRISFEEKGNGYFLERNGDGEKINIPHEGPKKAEFNEGMLIIKDRRDLTKKVQ